jgi:tetratricopeptide (TPR) repeat protein
VFGRQFKLADWRADVEAIERLTATEPVSAAQLLAREARIALNALDSNVAGMVAAGEQALALARTMNSPVAGTRVAITYAAHLSEAVGQHDQALQLLHAALARLDGSDANRNGPLLTQALCALAHAQARMGVAGPARETALRALTLTQLNPRLYAARADALHALGCADAQLGDWQSALAELHAAEQLHRDLGNVAAHLDVLRELAITRTMTGQHAKAQADFASWFAVSERAGLPTSSDMWRAAAADCAWALVTAGRVEAAEHALRPLMDWMQHGGAPWPRARAWTALAMLRMTQGQPGQAREALRPACKLSEQWHMCDATATLHLALVAQHLGDRALAEASLARADALSHGRERAHEAALLNWARYRVRGCLHSLAAARDELHRQAEHLTDRGDRQAFLVGVPLHRDIEAAWQRAQGAQSAAHMQRNVTEARETDATSLVMALARADAPLGRPLERDERVHVRLTIDAGPHDADVLQHEGKAGLRRHRLRRLIEQARGQGAAPTDADLARALNVNIRTIERDMAALRATRAGPLTRRRAARRMSIGVCRDGVEATQCTRERRDTARLSCD